MSVDVHTEGPADCRACDPFRGGPVGCLSHTCPDCGSIVHAELNAQGELTHRCPS